MIRSLLGRITLEPLIFFITFGMVILDGAQIQTNLLIWKICHLELDYPESICSNLTLDEYNDINDEVQEKANSFLMISEWLRSAPALVWSFFIGGLVDRFGCKPFLLLFLFGLLLSNIGVLLNFAFIEQLPLEFFYIEALFSVFGGFPMYYLAMYSYGSLVSKPKNRATKMIIYDGFDILANIGGVLLSAIVMKNLGRYANYGINCGCTFLAILYTIFVVKERKKPETEETQKSDSNVSKTSVKDFFKDFVYNPFVDLVKAVFQKRPYGLHLLIALQFFLYASYAFTWEEQRIRYLYMLKTFEGFDGVDYSRYSAFRSITFAIGSFLVMPILSKWLQIHDALLLALTLVGEGTGLILSAFSVKLWQFYGATSLQFLHVCKYGLVRSLLSKCISKNDIGKIYSALSIIAATIPMAGNGIMRTLYNKTLETFPAAEILLTAAIAILAAILNLFIYTQNWRIVAFTNLEKTENENNNLDKTEKFVESKHVPIIDSDTYL